VQNNTVGPNGRWGIFTGFAPEVLIFSNKCFRSGTEHGIYVSNSHDADDRPIVRANECFENAGNGIQFNGDCHSGGDGVISDALIENNIVHDNGVKGFSLISIADSVVQNNLIYNNGKTAGAGGIHLADEPDCGKPSTGNVIVNNTVVEPRIPGIQFSDGAKNNIVFNNIFVSDQPVTGGTGDNQVDDRSNVLRKTPEDLFVAPKLGDYRLSAASPARNAGSVKFAGKTAPTLSLTGQSRRTGWNINAGAYE
jgi:parallel beta-helix repeat protein